MHSQACLAIEKGFHMLTHIAWCNETGNPFRVWRGAERGWHCEKVSPGCANCYAETRNLSQRCGLGTGLPYARASRKGLVAELDNDLLSLWRNARVPKLWFVSSMTDVFLDFWSDEFRDQLFDAMEASCHTFLVLTKHIGRARDYLKERWDCRRRSPAPNIWLGVSIEDTKRAEERLPLLFATPAAHRFISYEPALELVDWNEHLNYCSAEGTHSAAVDWLIVGLESGPRARWPRDDIGQLAASSLVAQTIRQCHDLAIPCFVKQLGSRWAKARHAKDRKGADPSEWPADLRVHQFPPALAKVKR